MRTRALYALLIVAAGARLMLAVAAMPPYAGLDEAWHVARVAFVAREHRQPNIVERSIPPYIARAIRGEELPSFGEMRERWPEVVRSGHVVVERPFVASDLAPYESANYEAQQPPLYYDIAAKLAGGSAVAELRRLRLFSAFLALIVILAAASIGRQFFGIRGAVVAALIASLPTWITLVVRAGNDAMACALAAVAIAASASAPRGWRIAVEALLWAFAIATKLYVWPIAIVAVVFWRLQRGSWARIAIVVLACAISALITMQDLSARTRNPVGVFGFDAPVTHVASQPIAWVQMVKITIASMVWTSGQHADALRPAAMAIYVIPLIALILIGASRSNGQNAGETPALQWRTALGFALATFALAQLVEAAGFIRQAHAAGLALPLGGKEGWYWYALAPLLIPLFAQRARLAAFWLIAWDIVITDVALFHDFAGATSPLHRNFLFTWGPLHAPFTANLDGIAIGPFASHLVALRVIHLAAVIAAFCFLPSVLQLESTLHDRNARIGAAADAHSP
jgi:hypothetical protein